jgi:hypothetical protein
MMIFTGERWTSRSCHVILSVTPVILSAAKDLQYWRTILLGDGDPSLRSG